MSSVSVENGEASIHPCVYTVRGQITAKCLIIGECIIASGQAVPILQGSEFVETDYWPDVTSDLTGDLSRLFVCLPILQPCASM